MRVWDCDPAVLCNKHLVAQHAEVHFAIRCLEYGWKTKWKDVGRFKHHPRGLAWLGFIHEVTVHTLIQRGKFATHMTPVDTVHFEAMCDFFRKDYHGYGSDYMRMLSEHDYPLTELDQGTPWERDHVSFAWYRDHEQNWTRKLAALEAA